MDEQQTPPIKEQTPKQQVIEALKGANNVLITISKNPTVDQLAACIGLTLMMNKLDKHATAVFSGVVPSTLEFLQPEKTIEVNTDSLRDFIISLDKSKADKLRYKVEDDVVRIYITPYRTSISAADLEFTQGNFNVDVVVALGIDNKDELDAAIIEHGQILHDATVIDMSCGNNRPVDMGSINWHELTASSLSEMLVSISEAFKTGLLDTQMSTAFLTGIVAETDRFSNEKTTPKVMTMSAQLMAAGANQQLIANQLAIQPEPEPEPEPVPEEALPVVEPASVVRPDGELDINQHVEPVVEAAPESAPEEVVAPAPPAELNVASAGDNDVSFDLHKEEDHSTTSVNEVADSLGASGKDVTNTHVETDEQGNPIQPPEIEIDEHGNMIDLAVAEEEKQYAHKQRVIQPLNVEPPKPKTDLSNFNFDTPTPDASSQPQDIAPETNVNDAPVVPETSPGQPTESPVQQTESVPIVDDTIVPEVITDEPTPEQTLADLEKAVDSPHLAEVADSARDAIAGAVTDTPPASFDLPAEVVGDQNQDPNSPPPPPVPPPFMPPYMQPQKSAEDELNLPSPQ